MIFKHNNYFLFILNVEFLTAIEITKLGHSGPIFIPSFVLKYVTLESKVDGKLGKRKSG